MHGLTQSSDSEGRGTANLLVCFIMVFLKQKFSCGAL